MVSALLIDGSRAWMGRGVSRACCQLAAVALCVLVTSPFIAAQGPARPGAAVQTSQPSVPDSGRDGREPGDAVQRAPAGAPTASIRGRVLRSDTHLPLRGARVGLRAAPAALIDSPVVATDTAGQFELTGLSAGSYRLVASKGGFIMAPEDRAGAVEPAHAAGRVIELQEGEHLDDLELMLVPGGVLAGQLLDETGAPLAGAVVHARPEQSHNGRPWPHPSAAASDVTDDRGRFRVPGLPPGGYFLTAAAVSSSPGRTGWATSPTGLDATFFPGTTDTTQARVVYVDAGQQLEGLLFQFRADAAAADPRGGGAGAAFTAPAPARPAGTRGVLRGRVIREDGAAIAGARVLAEGSTDVSVLTDSSGRFELRVERGVYRLVASMSGFAQVHYGERLPERPFSPIQVESGQTIEDVEIVLPGAGVIAGQVMDERGEPAIGAIVQVLERRFVAGRRQAVSGRGIDRTDDRGEFRIHGILPGSYLLSASVSPLDGLQPLPVVNTGSLTTFYPGTFSEADALPLAIGPGDDLSGLVLTLLPGRLATVSGVVHTTEGQPARQAGVTLSQKPAFSASPGWSTRGTRVRADGTFSFTNLAPGAYTLHADLAPGRTQVAMAPVVLDGLDVVVPLVLREGHTASGHIVFEGDPKRPPPSRTSIDISFDAASPSETFPPIRDRRLGGDWTFEVRGLIGRRVLRVGLRQDWMLKAVRIGNTDVTDTPLDFGADISGIEVVLTNRIPEVSGTVVDAAGNPVPNATVVLFPADRRRWTPDSRFVAAVPTERNGRFTRSGLPPEDYLAVVVRDLEPGAETGRQTLERLQIQAATAFKLEEGGNVDLVLTAAASR